MTSSINDGRSPARVPRLVPFFGCGSHVPHPPPPRPGERRKQWLRRVAGPCPKCEGLAIPDRWPFVCMGDDCHRVAPGYEAMLGTAKAAAVAAEEPEKDQVFVAYQQRLAGNRKRKGSQTLSFAERADLIRDMRLEGELSAKDDSKRAAKAERMEQITRAWLDSIGQPAPSEERIQAIVENRRGIPGEPEPEGDQGDD